MAEAVEAEVKPEKVAPRTFTDYDGHTWSIEVTIPEVARVKKELGVLLLDLVDLKGELFQRITGDVIFLCDLLWVVCRPQAEQCQTTDEQFGRALRGDALEKALDALFLAVADFFPKERAALVISLHQRMSRYGQVAMELAAEKLNEATSDQQIQAAVLTALGLGESASVSPAGSASTRSPSAV